MVLEILGWTALALIALVAVWFAFRIFLVRKMAESFEVGVKVGKSVANMGQEWLDEQLLAAGLDPKNLHGPGRS